MFTYFIKFWLGMAALGLWLAAFSTVSDLDFRESGGVSSENPYRYTRFGWQDSRLWSPQVAPPRCPPVHPWNATALLVLGALAVYLWSSEEDEVAEWLQAWGWDSLPGGRRDPESGGEIENGVETRG
jgi:hypothetical protein